MSELALRVTWSRGHAVDGCVFALYSNLQFDVKDDYSDFIRTYCFTSACVQTVQTWSNVASQRLVTGPKFTKLRKRTESIPLVLRPPGIHQQAKQNLSNRKIWRITAKAAVRQPRRLIRCGFLGGG